MFNHNSDKTETVDEKLPLRKLPKLLVDLTSTERLNPREYTQQSIGSKTNDKQTCSVRKSKCKFVTAGGRDLFDFNVDPADLTIEVRRVLQNDVNPMMNKIIKSLRRSDPDMADWAEGVQEDMRDVMDELYDLGNEISMR